MRTPASGSRASARRSAGELRRLQAQRAADPHAWGKLVKRADRSLVAAAAFGQVLDPLRFAHIDGDAPAPADLPGGRWKAIILGIAGNGFGDPVGGGKALVPRRCGFRIGGDFGAIGPILRLCGAGRREQAAPAMSNTDGLNTALPLREAWEQDSLPGTLPQLNRFRSDIKTQSRRIFRQNDGAANVNHVFWALGAPAPHVDPAAHFAVPPGPSWGP